MRTLLLLIFFIGTKAAFASQPDSIVIYDNFWSYMNFYEYKYVLVNKGDKFVFYQTYKHIRDNKGESESFKTKKIRTISFENILSLTNALEDNHFSKLQLQNFGYDNDWILSNSDSLFSYVKDKNKHWTTQQISFVKQQLSDIDNFQSAVNRVVGKEGFYGLFKHSWTEFKATFYYKDQKPIEVNANENPFGMPWQVDTKKSFNPAIPLLFSEILPENSSYNKSEFSNFKYLMPELAKQIYDDKCRMKMEELAALEFQKEIDELKGKFKIRSASAYNYTDGYIDEDKQVIKIKIHDSTMVENLDIDLYLTREGNTLYTRDSLLAKAEDLVNTVQGIPFIKSFLLADTSRKLAINFKNEASINNKVIDRFNTTPEQWKYSDLRTASRKRDDSLGIINNFNTDEAIKRSIQINCGCNFRLDNNFLKKGIYFVIKDNKTGNSSTWIILPDSTIILWWIQGDGFSNFSYKDLGTNGISVQYVCKKFTPNGELEK
ncbi:MAG: hypothetical protein V4613_03780 [Bacteroidota bacterium]